MSEPRRQESSHALVRARATCRTARALAPADQARDGRWAVYTGVEIVPHLDGPGTRPSRIVFDLAGLTPATPRIIALKDHCTFSTLGAWDGFAIEVGEVCLDLHLTRPADEAEARALAEVVAIAAHLRNGVPIQCSIGAEWDPADQVLVPPGQSIEVNGQTYYGAGELPLYVVMRARLTEASLVTFGADSNTRKVAASASNPPTDPPMSDDTKPTEPTKPDACASLNAAAESITKAVAGLTTLVAKLADITVQPPPKDDKEPAGDEAKAKASATAGKAVAFATANGNGPGNAAAPASLVQAMAQLQAQNPQLKGIALHRAACAAHPTLAPGTCIRRQVKAKA